MSADQMVDHPPHYTQGGVECIEAIRAALTADEYRGYLKGQIFKYGWRERYKNRLQDIRKLSWYASELERHLLETLPVLEQS